MGSSRSPQTEYSGLTCEFIRSFISVIFDCYTGCSLQENLPIWLMRRDRSQRPCPDCGAAGEIDAAPRSDGENCKDGSL